MANGVTGRITFAVDDVEPATEALEECSMLEVLTDTVGAIVTCDAPERQVVNDGDHPLMTAVALAYGEHRPLVLTPDAIWITIAQGLATHIHQNAEALRHDLVRHEGTLKLIVEAAPTSPAWPTVIEDFGGLVRAHTPELHDLFVCDFSTSGPTERTASLVTLMAAVRDYFDFGIRPICGIPTITLEGTPQDWEKLRARVERLGSYGMADWVAHLRPLADAFLATASGNIDIDFWRSICKLQKAYGAAIINGWITVLFPFLVDRVTHEPTRKNPVLAHPPEAWRHDPQSVPGLTRPDIPGGLSCAAFTWFDLPTRTERAMEFLGGLGGVSQHPETLALRPEASWAVREAAPVAAVIERLLREAEVQPATSWETLHARLHGRSTRLGGDVPAEVMRLYRATDGARLGGVRILGFNELRWIRCDEIGDGTTQATRWLRFADLTDGTFLVLSRLRGMRECTVALSSNDTPGPFDEITIIAISFQEFLTRLLDGGPTPYFQQPNFVPIARALWFDPLPLSPTDAASMEWHARRTVRLARRAAESGK